MKLKPDKTSKKGGRCWKALGRNNFGDVEFELDAESEGVG